MSKTKNVKPRMQRKPATVRKPAKQNHFGRTIDLPADFADSAIACWQKENLLVPKFIAPCKEMVAHPDHYNRGGIECMQVSAAMVTGWSPQAAYRLGQAHDYIFRHAHKGQPVQDLEKAVFWIQEHIAALKAEAAAGAAS